MEREIEGGSPTLFRPIPNEYGTLDDPQEIEFSLLKCNGSLFTKEEQVRIETWLTAPKLSIPLYFVPNGNKSITGPTPYYYGVFTRTSWVPGGKGFLSVTLTFKPTTVYPFMKGSQKLNLKGSRIERKISVPYISPGEYIYPVITVKNNVGDFQIRNLTTGDNLMKLTGVSRISELKIDCKNCIITDVEKKKVLSFYEIGWLSVSDIVWFRLCHGTNELEIKGNGTATISYEMPYKKVGGWFE